VRVPVGPARNGAGVDAVRRWQGVGATHLTVDTMEVGLEAPDDHVDLLRRFKARLDEAAN
jgi:hypothetical protein